MADTTKLRYAKTHEWLNLDGTQGRVGISDYAQNEISDVVFVELPRVGRELKKGDSAMVVESVKAAFDIYAPVSGKVTRVNESLKDHPELINSSPFGDGWLFEIQLSQPVEANELMDQAQYDSSKGNH